MSEILTWALLIIYNAVLWRPPPLQRLSLWQTLGGPIWFSLCPLTLWFQPMPVVHVNSQVRISNLFHLHLKTFWACKHSYCWRSSLRFWAFFLAAFPSLQSNSSQTISAGLRSGSVEARPSDTALHHSPSWSNSPYIVWRRVWGHCLVEKQIMVPLSTNQMGWHATAE